MQWVHFMVCKLHLNEPVKIYPTLCDPIDGSPPGSPVPGKNTGVGCHFLLQANWIVEKNISLIVMGLGVCSKLVLISTRVLGQVFISLGLISSQ